MYSSKEQKAYYELSKSLLNQQNNDFSKDDVENVIQQLRDTIVFHEWKYYVKNEPVLSDFEYDSLYKFLERLEAKFPELITESSPTQRVSNDLTSDFESVEHLVPMLSLGNSYNADDLKDFDERIRKLTLLDEDTVIEYCVEPKFDGGSIAIVFQNDVLVRAATRGNGTMGEEITNNIKTLYTVPLKAEFSKKGIVEVELRGEALIKKDKFDKINAQRLAEGKDVFANPRNAATGGLRMKNPKETAQRGLEAFLYQMGHAVDKNGDSVLPKFKTHFATIEYLDSLGFKVPIEETKVCKTIEDVAKYCQEWEAKREQYGYEIDGMVVKVNDLALQDKCGYTGHHPRWALAYKFKAKQATSKLERVEFQVGKVGAITPVAKIKPVSLAGVTISSISLHNEEFIKSRDIRIGDTVLVERAGDVIPYIVKSLHELRDGSEKPFVFPKECPACFTPLIKEEAAYRCPNFKCEAQVVQRIIAHVSKDAMDIDGFGKSYVERFHQLGWLNDISDVYHLDYEKIKQLEGFGTRSAVKLEAAIEKAKKNPIYRLLYSLSIHHFGRKASKLVAMEIKNVMDLKDWDMDKFVDIKDIGPVVAENVIAFFSNPENIEMLERMQSYGVNMEQTEADRPVKVADDAPFVGKTILFTGKLLQMGRKEAQKMAEKAGAKNISSVSSNLDILVVGEKAGSKLKKAEKLGTVKIMTEQEFLDVLG